MRRHSGEESLRIGVTLAVVAVAVFGTAEAQPYQATGLKIGEVTSTSAVVWARGTVKERRGLTLKEFNGWLKETGGAASGAILPDDLSDLGIGDDDSGVVGTAVGVGTGVVTRPAGAAVEVGKKTVLGPVKKLFKFGKKTVTNPVGQVKNVGKKGVGVGDTLLNTGPIGLRHGILRLGAVPGKKGRVEVRHRPTDGSADWASTGWLKLEKGSDFTRQAKLDGLKPDTEYEVQTVMYTEKGSEPTSTLRAKFRTAPAPESARPITFTIVTGQAYRTTDDRSKEVFDSAVGTEEEREDRAIMGHRIYREMVKLNPDFMAHTGDVVYYDHQGASARSARMARMWWQRMFSLRNMVEFHNQVPVYYMKDDHDTLKNDCWPGQSHRWLSYKKGREIFHEQTPLSLESKLSINGGKPYRTVRWGQHLQIWLTEVRDYRSPNTRGYDDPRKTMLGKAQLDWLAETLEASDATFRVVICQGPIVGPDRPEEPDEEEKSKLVNRFRPPRIDNLANRAWHLERSRLLDEILADKKNLILMIGDRHWKYHSVYPSKAEPWLHELSCGSVSDKHAMTGLRMIGVPTPSQDETLVWRDEVEQGGFLSARLDTAGGQPRLTAKFHKVDGSMAYPRNASGAREVVFYADGRVDYTQ